MSDRFNVLVVDDNSELVETFKDILEFKGFKVSTALSGAEAVDEARRNDPDVVLLDLMMPGMSGLEAMEAIRSFHDEAEFVVITAYSGSEQASQSKRDGALEVFPKPLVVEDVVALLNRLRTETANRAAVPSA